MGIELQHGLQRIAAANVVQNGLGERIEILAGDLVRPPPRFAWGSFDHVMTNPPHLAAPATSAPPLAERAIAHVEGAVAGRLAAACLRLLRPGGTLTLIHRAERLGEWCAALGGPLGALVVFPLWPGPGRPARRVLVQGRKGSRAPLALMPGLVLHEADGRLSAAADAVLRHGEALPLQDAPEVGPADG